MPTPSRYDVLAARLHGRRKLAGLSFIVFMLLTALCVVAFRAKLLPPIRILVAGVMLLFSVSAWSGGVYILCDWFDPEEGYLHSSFPPKKNARTNSVMPWVCAIFVDFSFLVAAALTLSALRLAF
ncbi:MAG TPA: hypothetical protein VK714_19615 [Myxococcota bacterium]|nr:hypothetical protein [Myxococcota bacterium]